VYLSGCREPVVARDGRSQAAPAVRLFDGARLRSPAGVVTLGTQLEQASGGQGTIVAFDWNTLEVKPLLPADRPIACRIVEIEAATEGTGLVAVRTHCGCIDCDDGGSYAIDTATGTLHPIFNPGQSVLMGRVVLDSAVVTAVPSVTKFLGPGQQDGPGLLWTDASGTRVLGPLPGVLGMPHHPVR
jgi:hypothetical protein